MPARRILVVDDEGTIRRIVADMLSLSGFDVVQAEDAGQAVDVARETPPDLLLSDLSLPDGDGCEVLRAVREIHPEVRAVVMTGLVDSASTSAARSAGFEFVICKPFSLKALIGTVERALL